MTSTSAPSETSGTRLHGLDALRAVALGLGIVLHSLMPFIPGMPWLVSDSASSDLVLAPFYWIHLFRMALFMALAGYFGHMVLERRGWSAYLKGRLLRITLPLFAFWPIAVVSLGMLAGLGAAIRGEEPPQPQPPQEGAPAILAMFDPGQLWFLWVLTECIVITLIVRAAARRLLGADRSGRLGGRIATVLSARGGALPAAVPYLIALLVQGSSQGGITEPNTLLPELGPLAAYLGAFGVGWFLHIRGDALQRIAAQWPVQTIAAVLLSVLGFALTPEEMSPILHAGVIALAGWTWTYALIGMSVRFLRREIPAVRYLADSSYWSYLLHLPLLIVIEIVLADQPWPILAKLAISWAVVGVLLLISYDLLVRGTWIGRWINGHRRSSIFERLRSQRRSSAQPPAATR